MLGGARSAPFMRYARGPTSRRGQGAVASGRATPPATIPTNVAIEQEHGYRRCHHDLLARHSQGAGGDGEHRPASIGVSQ